MKIDLTLSAIVLILCLLFVTACEPKGSKIPISATTREQLANPALSTGETVPLTIVGYNYTDKDINDFYVDGTGGGNLYVSSASGGGGGSVCCSTYTIGSAPHEISLRWQSDACTYGTRVAEDGEVFYDIHSFYTTEAVKVNASASSTMPRYLEIHIFPDRPAQAYVTDEISPPRLSLDQNRRVNTPFRKCPNDAKPTE
ncbi:DUF3304 domain-containing protein [Massilia sp. PAMC28688]|uniref:DUF3304 domain-containing protein n=1 Tax=Massilia sp. PAMC28688 TaxID=2861283 RepID=UPI001C633B14|nr:DUF3304 domain-containing protein [Massilia sp. PAMC28688]QYF91595.1 DUF3304 domain-containing protein [Massilia sp. PAMC28688]